MSHTTVSSITSTRPTGQTWFIIAADAAFGWILALEAANVAASLGGHAVGSAAYPFPSTTHVSACLLQARAAGVTVIAVCRSCLWQPFRGSRE